MAKSDKYAVRSADAKLIAGIEAGIWGKAGAEKMAAYLLSPAFLRAFYEERIVQLEAALPEPEFDARSEEYEALSHGGSYRRLPHNPRGHEMTTGIIIGFWVGVFAKRGLDTLMQWLDDE